MIEIGAAALGAILTWAGMGAMGAGKRSGEARDAITRLGSSVGHIATQLEVLDSDVRDHQKEMFGRLNDIDHRVTTLEASSTWDGRNRRK
jgi:hypothetical protein